MGRARRATGIEGTILGRADEAGTGGTGHAVGEVCFNTAMTGYEEILTDPSYAGQLITFTFPHIGNVGTNEEDIETVNMAATPGARGVILRTAITDPSSYRATLHLDQWLKRRGIIGLSGIDTRALTSLIRQKGMPNAVIAHAPDGQFDLDALKKEAREWPGLEGMDLVPMVTSGQRALVLQRAQPLVEMLGGAVVRGIGDGRAQNHAARAGRRRHVDGFEIFVVGTDVADMREREGNELSGIRGIGEDLLIAGHRRVEADFAHGLAFRTEAEALQHGAVRKHEERGRFVVRPG